MSQTPVRLGDALREVREAEDQEAETTSGKHLCENCFHQAVCAVASAAELIGAQISACPQHFAALDTPEAPG